MSHIRYIYVVLCGSVYRAAAAAGTMFLLVEVCCLSHTLDKEKYVTPAVLRNAKESQQGVQGVTDNTQ